VNRGHSADYYQVDIYKHAWVAKLLEALDVRGAPRTLFDHWVNRKSFGYSDNEIADYVSKLNGGNP